MWRGLDGPDHRCCTDEPAGFETVGQVEQRRADAARDEPDLRHDDEPRGTCGGQPPLPLQRGHDRVALNQDALATTAASETSQSARPTLIWRAWSWRAPLVTHHADDMVRHKPAEGRCR